MGIYHLFAGIAVANYDSSLDLVHTLLRTLPRHHPK